MKMFSIHCGAGNCRFDSITDGTYGFKILLADAGGRRFLWSCTEKVFTTKDEAMDVIEKAILLFRERGLAGEKVCGYD